MQRYLLQHTVTTVLQMQTRHIYFQLVIMQRHTNIRIIYRFPCKHFVVSSYEIVFIFYFEMS
jgi:hypothetical protein